MKAIRFIKGVIIALLLVFSVLCIDIYVETYIPKVNKVHFETPKLPAGSSLKIVQITDLHNMEFGEGNQRLIKEVEDLDPDIIVLTGDLIDVRSTNYENAYSLVEGLVRINPEVYFVSGNHERWNPDSQNILNGFEDRKVKILNYNSTVFNKGDISVNLCGVEYAYVTYRDSYRFYVDEDKFNRMFDELDKSKYTILLSHTPKILEVLDGKTYDLILSGHTHGGQVRLPFIKGITYLGDPFYEKYDKGVFRLDDGRMLYVDSGVGTSILPVRFLNRSQISYITINGIK